MGVHSFFEAPYRAIFEPELDAFIAWFNQSKDDTSLDPLLRAAITHLWFVTHHPLDDGNLNMGQPYFFESYRDLFITRLSITNTNENNNSTTRGW